MKHLRLAALGAVLLTVVLAGYIGWHARPFDQTVHTRIISSLGKLQELDSDLDEAVLKLRGGLLNNYDPLVATLSLLHAHKRDLELNAPGLGRVGGAELETLLGRIGAKIAEKESLLERFKSRNALLRNSYHYFPLSADKLVRDRQLPDELRNRIHQLQRAVLQLRVGATQTDYELVGLQISQLRASPLHGGARENMESALLHAANLIEHQDAVDRLVAQVTAAELKRASASLAEAYNSAFGRKFREANIYRFVLLLLSVTLLTYAAFAFVSLRRTQAAVRESEERYRKLFDLSPDGMLTHAEGKVVMVNSACMKLFGAERAEQLAGRSLLELFHADYHDRIRERMRDGRYANRTAPPEERKIVRLDGGTLEVEVTAARLVHLGKPSVQVVVRDITERKKATERLNYLAQYDSLTGLPNRSLFRDRLAHDLEQARRSGRPAALLFIDLDAFKGVNDTLGHATGDKLLQQVAARLKDCVRSGDTVGRFGGDEFGVILMHLAKPADAGLVAQKINESLAQPFDLEGHRTFVSASIGITVYPADAADPEALSMNADTAMYRAKENGRNTYQFFTPQMNERARHRMQIETAMRLALERGEFVLHYQPKVELASGSICGIEALLRWLHPQRGLVSPAEFVPVLEETGLIVPVGEWVMREACGQIASWQAAGLAVPPVAVNLSSRQFQDKDLEQTMRRIIAQAGIDAALLQLELTESLLMHDPKSAERVLCGLKSAGVKLSIDDFGTGYSSLAYLRRFPLDVLKIDRAFIKDIVANPDDAAITLAVINLAHSLMLSVVAEGVETEAQVNLLALHGCDEIQGYYFSKPVPAADLEALVRRNARLKRSNDWATSEPAVLLVDDDEHDLRLLERALRSETFPIHTATSAEKAFALLANHPIGVVVSDQRMPGMNGAEFLQKLGRLYPGALRVAISGTRDDDVIASAVNQASIHKFLSKTWDSARLASEIREIYQRAIRDTVAA